MAGDWVWNRRVYHLVGYRKKLWKALEHPNIAGWHWGMNEPSPEDLEMGIHKSPQTISQDNETIPTLKMEDRPNPGALRKKIRDVDEKVENLREVTARTKAMLKKTQAPPRRPATGNDGFGTIHVSTTNFSICPPPGFPPPLPTQLSFGGPPPSFTPRASSPPPQIASRSGLAPQTRTFVPQTRASAFGSQTLATLASESESEFSVVHHSRHHLEEPYISHHNNLQLAHNLPLLPDQDTMATSASSTPKPARVRSLSPEDIGKFIDQARRRNANRVTPPRLSSPQVPQIVISPEDSSSSSAGAQYAQYGTVNQAQPPPTFAIATAHSGQHAVARSRQIDRVLGHDLGLDSNMPSQVSRTPQEAAVAAARHAQRVRSMQYTLATDPNLMIHQASGTSAQLTAAGPPLTQGLAQLPSVLTPYSRTPMMNYKDAFQAIIAETGPLDMLLRLTLLEPAHVTVLMYDDMNRSLGVSEGLVLTKQTDLKALVTLAQTLLDMTVLKLPGNNEHRFIVQAMDVRNGSDEMKAGHPPLKGECRGGDKVKTAKKTRWIVGGEMEQYWQVLRIELQMGAPQPGDKKPVVKPIFRVKTVRQIAGSRGLDPIGHEFIDVSTPKPTPGAVQDIDRRREDSDDDKDNGGPEKGSDHSAGISQGMNQLQLGGGGTTAASSSAKNTGFSKNGGNVNKTHLRGDAGGSTPGSSNEGFSNDNHNHGDKASEPSQAKEESKAKPIDPTRNWGYYQRLGGDPRNHKLYDLSHVPFEVEDFPVPELKFDTATEQEIIARIQAEGWNFAEPQDSVTPKASTIPAISAEKQAWLDKANEQFEKAKGFEDDGSYFPNYDTEMPDARKIGAPHSARKTPFESYDVKGKGKAEHLDSNNLHRGSSALDVSQARIDRIVEGNGRTVSRFAGAFNNSNMRQSTMGKTTPSGTKMNVHAPDFTYMQYMDPYGSNSNSMPPYLQSLAGLQPGYTQSNPYGMIGQVGSSVSSAPSTHNPSPTKSGRQVPSLHKSDSSGGFTTFSIPALHPQQSGVGYSGSSGGSSPDKMFAQTGAIFGAATRQAPQYSQQSRGHGQRVRSPERLNSAGYGGVPALRYPSPEKFTRQDHGMGYQHGHPPMHEPTMQPGSGPGCQYVQKDQYNFNFDYQPHVQGHGQTGG